MNPNTEILLTLLRVICWVVYNQLYEERFLFAGALVTFARNNIS